MRSKYALIAVGYNRCDSLQRLVKSLQDADYCGDRVDLIFSIDNSGTDVVEKYAKTVNWDFGNKYIRTFPERQGLRNHILQCGDYTDLYEAIAIFEDDLFVSPGFYSYMKQAVEFYEDNNEVAGISLYNHLYCENSQKPFTAQIGEYDNYFLQYAQSWGQVWLQKQWKSFRNWYSDNNGDIFNSNKLPDCLRQWPQTSWLKYHIAYCILNKKYFIYPYKSFTTNYMEIGQHCKSPNTLGQVPLYYGRTAEYHFCKFGSEDGVYYDGFFQRECDLPEHHLGREEIVFDLDGVKSLEDSSTRYIVTTRQLNYQIIASYAIKLRPIEMNVLMNIPGDSIYLYDTNCPQNNTFRDTFLDRWFYDTRVMGLRPIIRATLCIIKKRFYLK